jgi:hypothetical protein
MAGFQVREGKRVASSPGGGCGRSFWARLVAALTVGALAVGGASVIDSSFARATPSTQSSRPLVELSPYASGNERSDVGWVDVRHVESAELRAREELGSGGTLWQGDSLWSANRQYRLAMQRDGNLVLYFHRRALWNAGTAGHPGAHAIMQGDGNFVVYAPRHGPALWDSHTNGHPGATLAVQTDGNVVVYASDGQALWATYAFVRTLEVGERLNGTEWFLSANGAVRLAMRRNGNVALYGGNRTLWTSRTYGHPGAFLRMQRDGNLVVYSASGRALWNSHTNGRAGSVLNLRSDGNLVVTTPSGGAAWASNTSNDSLRSGEGLRPGQFLVAESGATQLQMQGDGNLVVYTNGRAIWDAHTQGHAGAYLAMQSDGNLVVYPPSGAALWNSQTNGHPGAFAHIQSDSNFVVYQGSAALWSSNAPPPPTGNAAIADIALRYVGQYGGAACVDAGRSGYTGGAPLGSGNNDDGECRAFVNCIVWMASGHRKWLGGGSDYFSQFTREGGTEVALAAAAKGDIVQWPTSHLHTTIIVANLGGGRYDVVDSNHNLDHRVNHYVRTITGGEGARAFRMNL